MKQTLQQLSACARADRAGRHVVGALKRGLEAQLLSVDKHLLRGGVDRLFLRSICPFFLRVSAAMVGISSVTYAFSQGRGDVNPGHGQSGRPSNGAWLSANESVSPTPGNGRMACRIAFAP